MKRGWGFILMYFLVIVFCVSAYITNIVKLVHCDFQAPYKAEVVRVVGLFPVVGFIVGFMDIDDTPAVTPTK